VTLPRCCFLTAPIQHGRGPSASSDLGPSGNPRGDSFSARRPGPTQPLHDGYAAHRRAHQAGYRGTRTQRPGRLQAARSGPCRARVVIEELETCSVSIFDNIWGFLALRAILRSVLSSDLTRSFFVHLLLATWGGGGGGRALSLPTQGCRARSTVRLGE